MPRPERQVFLNVPFDRRYRRLFHALVFSVHDCGFTSRCALEQSDSAQVRLDKLYELIGSCRFGIHDLSRTTLDGLNHLPRFNMPLELGIALGAKRFGAAEQRRKFTLILDSEPFRYQKFCSDIAGQDVRSHSDTIEGAVASVRSWLRESAPKLSMPGEVEIEQRFYQFWDDLPTMCRVDGIRPANLGFIDLRAMVDGWQSENPRASERSVSN